MAIVSNLFGRCILCSLCCVQTEHPVVAPSAHSKHSYQLHSGEE